MSSHDTKVQLGSHVITISVRNGADMQFQRGIVVEQGTDYCSWRVAGTSERLARLWWLASELRVIDNKCAVLTPAVAPAVSPAAVALTHERCSSIMLHAATCDETTAMDSVASVAPSTSESTNRTSTDLHTASSIGKEATERVAASATAAAPVAVQPIGIAVAKETLPLRIGDCVKVDNFTVCEIQRVRLQYDIGGGFVTVGAASSFKHTLMSPVEVKEYKQQQHAKKEAELLAKIKASVLQYEEWRRTSALEQ